MFLSHAIQLRAAGGPDGPTRWASRKALWRLAAEHALFGIVPVVFSAWYAAYAVRHHSFAVDFHNAYWPAGQRVLHGLSPYVAASNVAVTHGTAFVYPAFAGLFFAVMALLPHTAADVVFTVGSLAAALLALRLLGVRDWRLYGLTALWPAVTSGWQTANLTLLLVLGVAVAWRVRSRPAAAGAVLAILVSLKAFFLWPLGLWLLVSRRHAALAWAIAIGIVINVFAWAVLGFDQVHAYVVLARAVSKVEQATAYTPLALALRLGAAQVVAYAIEIALVLAAAALCVRMGRLEREASALLLAVVICLLATPTVWRHYFALLLVPLAISRPTLNAVWLVPLVAYLCPLTSPSLWQLCLVLAATTLVVGMLLHDPEAPGLRAAIRGGLAPRRPARAAL